MNAVDKGGWSAVCQAAYHGHKDILQLLLDRGAQIETVDRIGNTPLLLVTCNELGHKEKDIIDVLALLLERGAICKAVSSGGWTALHFAARKGYKDAILLLLENGAQVAASNQVGRTPLHYAAASGHRESVVILLERGTKIDAADEGGFSALHFAAFHGHSDVLALLLERGAKVTATVQGCAGQPGTGTGNQCSFSLTRARRQIRRTGRATPLCIGRLERGTSTRWLCFWR